MKIYNLKNDLLIVDKHKVYFIWNYDDPTFLCIDELIIVNEKTLTWISIKIDAIGMRPAISPNQHQDIERFYENRASFSQINPERLLTHKSPLIRKFIKELTHANL